MFYSWVDFIIDSTDLYSGTLDGHPASGHRHHMRTIWKRFLTLALWVPSPLDKVHSWCTLRVQLQTVVWVEILLVRKQTWVPQLALAVYQASKSVFVLVNLAAVVCQIFQAFYIWSISTTFGNFCFKHTTWKWEMCTEITCQHLEQVEGFWGCYCHLARPSTLPNPTDIHLFKEGIRPLWEVFACRPNLFFQHPPDQCGKEHLFKW
jgi:hypothetical protein